MCQAAKSNGSMAIATGRAEMQSSFADYKKFHEKIAPGTSKFSRAQRAILRNIFAGEFV